MRQLNLQPKLALPLRQRRIGFGSQRGVTLVELMMSTILFTIVSITTLTAIFQAYILAAQVRYRDQARFVLTSVVDQFLTATVTDSTHPNLALNGPRDFFAVSATPTGLGMSWYPDGQVFLFTPVTTDPYYPLTVHGTNDANGLQFEMAVPTTRSVTAKITRVVQAVNPATGAVVPGPAVLTATGCLLRGDFSISFVFRNKTYTESTTVLRSIP